MIGQELEADGGIEEDTGHEDGETDDRVLEEAEAEAEGFEGTLGDHVARRADQGEVAAHRSRKHQRHQQARALEAGLGGNADDHGDQHGGGAGIGENAAHQADDDHDGNDEAALGLGEFGDEAADLVGHAGFKQGTADDEHGDKQNDVGINEAGESGLEVENLGQNQTHGDDHGGKAEGDLFSDEHDDGEEQEEQRNNCRAHGLSSL